MSRKIIARTLFDFATGRILEENSFQYDGPIAMAMPDARNFGDCIVTALLPAAADASGQTTASGSWIDISNYIGDILIVVNVGSITGSFGSVNVQAQCSLLNTGGTPVSCVDARNSGLLTVSALGAFAMAINGDDQPKNFIGVACTYTTLTAAVMSVEIIGRKANN